MRKRETVALGFVLGTITPIFFFLAFWWSTFLFMPGPLIGPLALLGLATGLIIDLCCLKKWIAKAYNFDLKIWMGIYVFYSICVFGFFMGVPVFNVALAIPAGFFIGNKLAHVQAEGAEYTRLARRTCVFTTLVMVFVCLSSAFFAIRSPSTSADLQGMLRLGFEVTPAMIYWLIALGGMTLLILQWWLTSKMIRLAYKWNR